MKNLIKALIIFLKYNDCNSPTHCEHDVLMIMGVTQDQVSQEDKDELDTLGFFWNDEHDCWASYRYGSA